MADPTPNPAPLAASPSVTIDAANVVHDAERTTRHGLSHLEGEFVAEWQKLETYTETEAKKLLAWVASELPKL